MKNYRGQKIPSAMFMLDFENQCNQLIMLLANRIIEPFEAIRTLHKSIDSVCSSFKSYTSCSINCHQCCYIYIETSRLESDLIKYEINSLPGFIREEVQSKTEVFRNQWRQFRMEFGDPKLDSDLKRTYFFKKIPCAFLIDTKCSIYRIRPYTCRTHFAFTDPEECRLLDKTMIWANKMFRTSAERYIAICNMLTHGVYENKPLPAWL